MKKSALFILFVFVSLTSCATEEQIVKKDNIVTVLANPSIPKLAQPIKPINAGEFPPSLVLGTRFTFRQGNVVTKNWTAVQWVVKDLIEWQGNRAYVIDIGGSFIIWDMNLNYLATLSGDGKVVSAANPSIRTYLWPLKLGTTYDAVYDYYSGGKKVMTSKDSITIENITDVTVPMGNYSAFVLKRVSTGLVEKIYFSPLVGFPVKWQWSQSMEHSQGPGEFSVELVKIEK
jgi:hypothetical protein